MTFVKPPIKLDIKPPEGLEEWKKEWDKEMNKRNIISFVSPIIGVVSLVGLIFLFGVCLCYR